jgi:hypothetical protein
MTKLIKKYKGKIKKEKWILIEPKNDEKKLTVIPPPSRPPPRVFSEIQASTDKIDIQIDS